MNPIKNIIGITICFLWCGILHAQSLAWHKTYGGYYDDRVSQTKQLKEGGYIIAGSSNSSSFGDVVDHIGPFYSWYTHDYWIVKITEQGSIVWAKSYGGSADDVARSIEQTADGGYIIAGSTSSNDIDVTMHYGADSTYDCWILKLDSSGKIQWKKTFGGSLDDEAIDIKQTKDKGYIFAGCSISNDSDVSGHHNVSKPNYDIWVVKLDSMGSLIWQKCYGGSSYEIPQSILLTSDSGFVILGYTFSTDGDVSKYYKNSDVWIIKIGNDGKLKWDKTFGGSQYEYATTIINTHDMGYLFVGSTGSTDFDLMGHKVDTLSNDYWIVKIDSLGSIIWQKCYGGSNDELAFDVKISDNGYIICGRTNSNDGDISGNKGGYDYWVIKIDSLAKLEWQKCLGGTKDETASSIFNTKDKGYLVLGSTKSNDDDVSGHHYYQFNIEDNYDYWAVKLNQNVNIDIPNILYNFNIYPNPTLNNLTIHHTINCKEDLFIYNALGGLVYKDNWTPDQTQKDIDVSLLSKGIYILRIGNEVQKLIKE